MQTLGDLVERLPHERERASTYTLAQQVKAVLNQRLVKTLCQGCAHKTRADELLSEVELARLGLAGNTGVAKHNQAGCDLCNRTGILGRTLLLDALLITAPVSERNGVYKSLRQNVNDVLDEPGVIFRSRREGVIELMTSGLVDPRAGILYIDE